MNDLVYVMYNLKLKNKQVKRGPIIPFDDIQSDDEWITEKGDDSNEEEVVQPLGGDPIPSPSHEIDDMVEVGNVELVGSSNNVNLDELQNMVLDAIGEEFCSSEEEVNDDDDDADEIEDDGGDSDGGFEF